MNDKLTQWTKQMVLAKPLTAVATIEGQAMVVAAMVARVIDWKDIARERPPHGVPVLFWNADWIDADFNPQGTRDGFWTDNGDPEDYTSAAWQPEQDVYYADYEKPTHWAAVKGPLL